MAQITALIPPEPSFSLPLHDTHHYGKSGSDDDTYDLSLILKSTQPLLDVTPFQHIMATSASHFQPIMMKEKNLHIYSGSEDLSIILYELQPQ